MENIKTLANDYQDQKKKVKERRDTWKKKSNEVYNYLSEIADQVDLSWKAGKDEMIKNRVNTGISINPRPSGISGVMEGKQVHYAYKGCELCYYQLINSEIYVFMTFPYIKELQPKPEHKKIDVVNPGEISKEMINGHVETFLSNLIRKDPEESSIGFRSFT